MQTKSTSYAGLVTQWAQLSAALAGNTGDIPHLENHRQLLDGLLAAAQALSTEQATHAAAKQDVSKQLQDVLNQGQKLATFLRTGIRQHFGNRSEKLVEFGLQPFRGRSKPADPARPPVELTAPEATLSFTTEQ